MRYRMIFKNGKEIVFNALNDKLQYNNESPLPHLVLYDETEVLAILREYDPNPDNYKILEMIGKQP